MCARDRRPSRIRIGDVYMMLFDGTGSEQGGFRPGLVFQNNVGNLHSPNLIALPLTTSVKKLFLPTHVFLSASDSGLPRDSVVLCENPQRMSKERVGRFIVHLPNEMMKRVAIGHLMASAAISFIDLETLVKIWENSIRLNA